jgi:hypothetical protein
MVISIAVSPRFTAPAPSARVIALEQQKNRVSDLFFLDRNDLVHILLNQSQGQFSSATHRDSVAIVFAGFKVTSLPSATATFTEGILAGWTPTSVTCSADANAPALDCYFLNRFSNA